MGIRKVVFFVSVLFFILLCASCLWVETGATGDISDGVEAMKEYHFREMDISLPQSWKGSGNMCRFYRNVELPGAYVMVSSFGNSLDITPDEMKERLEEDISENLELFESTEFYKHKIEFIYEYDKRDEGTGDRLVQGKLKNGRLNIEMHFYGYYIETPVAYVFGICKDDNQLKAIKSVIDGAMASAYIQENVEVSESS